MGISADAIVRIAIFKVKNMQLIMDPATFVGELVRLIVAVDQHPLGAVTLAVVTVMGVWLWRKR